MMTHNQKTKMVMNPEKTKTQVQTEDILHLRSSFDPGGTETLLLNLFNYPQSYITIHLVLLKAGSLIDQLDLQNGNQCYRWYRKRFLDFSVLKKIRGLIREKNIAIVHTHQFIELVYAVFLKLLQPKLKIVHQVHLMFQKRNAAFFLERFLSQQFAQVVTVSESSKEEMVQSFGFSAKNIKVLYNAVDFDPPQSTDRALINQKVKVPLRHDRINIVMVANFVWGKDHDTLFKAYDRFIRDQLPQVAFYFIGRESDISEDLKQKYLRPDDITDGRMVFTGPIPNAKSLLPAFDMVIMSCFSETFNLALVEAAAMGKVVLASNIPVFRELSDYGKYFYHFKAGDPEDLFDSLAYLIANFQGIAQLDHSQHFQQKYGLKNFTESLNQIYQKEKAELLS